LFGSVGHKVSPTGEGTKEEASSGPSGPISSRVASGLEAGWPTSHEFGPFEGSVTDPVLQTRTAGRRARSARWLDAEGPPLRNRRMKRSWSPSANRRSSATRASRFASNSFRRRPRRTSASRAAIRFRASSHCARSDSPWAWSRSHSAKSHRPFGQVDSVVIVLYITYPETLNK
jgi:hypothetical protein